MKNLLQKTHLRALMLVALVLCGLGTAWGEKVTYTISSKNTLTTTGTAPSGSSATIVETYSTSKQMTSGNSQTLTLTGYEGYKITKLTLSMHSNKSGGQGYLKYSTDGGSNYTYIVGNAENSIGFNKQDWNGAWSTEYVNIEKAVEITPTSSNLVFCLGAGTNSIFCQSYTITYEALGGSTPDLENSDLALTGAPVALTFDLFDNSAAQIINYTTSSTGAVTVSESEYVTTSVNGNTITVTPIKVTPSAQTITVSQAADDTYAAGSATFTITISNNDPNRLGGANNPYTVAQALENTPASGNSEDVYVKGIVSKFQAADIMSDGTNYRYYISDDGTTNNQLLVYKGKGLNNVAFSNADDLQIGDVVVVKGPLSIYNSTKEINSGNYIVSLKRKTTPTLSFSENAYSVVKNGTLTITATSNSTGAITYESSNTDVAEIDATSGVVTAKAAGTTTITATIAATDDYKSATATVELTVTAPTHIATFYQNGTKRSEAEVSENVAITFPDAEPEIYGKKFVGWTMAAINGTTETPELVNNPIMGTTDVNYYAVYATQESEEILATVELTNDQIKAVSDADKQERSNYKSRTIGDWTGKFGVPLNNSVYSLTLNRKTSQNDGAYNSHLTTPNCSSPIKSITINANSVNSNGCTLYLCATDDIGAAETDGSSASYGSGRLSEAGELIIDVTNSPQQFHIYPSASISIGSVSLTYSTPAVYSAYCTTVLPPVKPAKPIVFHDGGTYEGSLTVPMYAEEGATIYYTIDGTEPTTESNPYTEPLPINDTTNPTTVKAIAVKGGVPSDVVTRKYTITAAEAGPAISDGYYTIKNNGNNKYVQVAGRKTVVFADNTNDAGTVIRVKTNTEKPGQVEILRSQGVDIPGYAQRAMNYVPELVKAIVDRLGENNFIGEPGLNNVATEFTNKFDYNLYLEKAKNDGEYYRIYGKTPSMTPVVDFYAKNKEVIDGRLPYLEGFVKDIFTRIADKIGHGQGWVDSFKIHDLWVKMGGTESGLTEPVDDDAAAISQFYTEVLSSEKNVWNFAHETMMIYWGRVKEFLNGKTQDLGEYAKFIDKVEYIQPNFKYYIVQKDGQMDFISQENSDLITDPTAESDYTVWTLKERKTFDVNLNISQERTVCPVNPEDEGNSITYMEYYTTLYTDFAYDLPEGVTAYKVEGINTITNKTDVTTALVKKSVLKETTIPAQTPVLLMADKANLTLTLNANEGSAVESELHGTDWLINEYEINTPTVEGIFTILHELSESLAEQYEYLQRRNAGTVNNKYFFGIAIDGDFDKYYKAKTGNEMESSPVSILNKNNNGKIAFIETWDPLANNEGFMFSEDYSEILLSMVGDVNRDGQVSIADVTALVNIILGKATYPADADKYDFEAANVNGDGIISISDVTALVNIILGK